jgi:hypothetical protein
VYLLPFQIPDFIEAAELLQTELLVLLLWVFVQSLEDAHHLPLSCNDKNYCGEMVNEGTLKIITPFREYTLSQTKQLGQEKFLI